MTSLLQATAPCTEVAEWVGWLGKLCLVSKWKLHYYLNHEINTC